MEDGTYTQQITVIENGELLKTEYRDIGNIEANQLIQSGRGELVSQYQGVRSNSPLTSWSTAKSFSGILIGIAQDQDLLNIDDKASVYLDEWLDDDRKDITIRNIPICDQVLSCREVLPEGTSPFLMIKPRFVSNYP